MSEAIQEKKSSSKTIIILLIVLIVLVIGGVVTAIILLNRNKDENSGEAEETQFTIGYEGNGVAVLDSSQYEKMMEEMIRSAQEGNINVQYETIATSEDGVNFECSIGNSPSNAYDMYLNIYLEHDLDQQMLLTGLIPPGEKLEKFVSEIPLEPGEYESTLVFTQVKDDHATICGQSMVVLNLLVGDFSYEEEEE